MVYKISDHRAIGESHCCGKMPGIINQCDIQSHQIAHQARKMYGMVFTIAFGIEPTFVSEKCTVIAPNFIIQSVRE